MAYTDEQVAGYLTSLAQSGQLNDTTVAADMARSGVSPEQVARVTNLPVSEVAARYAMAAPVDPAARGNYSDQQVAGYLTSMAQAGMLNDERVAAEMARYGVGVDQIARVTKLTPTEVQRRFSAAVNPSATPAYSDDQLKSYLFSNYAPGGKPNFTDPQIVMDMIRGGVGVNQLARVLGMPVSEIQTRFNAVIDPLNSRSTTLNPFRPTDPSTLPPADVTINPGVIPPITPAGAINENVRSTPAINSNVTPVMPNYYIEPAAIRVGGSLVPDFRAPPPTITPFALPSLNLRNRVNTGVVPRFVTGPKSSGNLFFTPIEQIETSVF